MADLLNAFFADESPPGLGFIKNALKTINCIKIHLDKKSISVPMFPGQTIFKLILAFVVINNVVSCLLA